MARAEEDLRRRFAEEHPPGDWVDVRVPSHWRNTPGFEDAEGVLYRHRFETAGVAPGERHWLVLDGLCYQGDVWLDGTYLGDTEGYFMPHCFEITEPLRNRSEHLLAVEATCTRPNDLRAKRNITGVLQHWDCLDPELNPGGIWRPVRLERTGPVRLAVLRCMVVEADDERAIVQFHAELDSVATHTVTIRTVMDPAGATPAGAVVHSDEEHLLSKGSNTIEWRVAVEEPDLWWPHSLGGQPMYDLRVEVLLAGRRSHLRKRRMGLRHFRLRNWIATVNGEQIFLKGTNLGPVDADLASAGTADFARDLDLAIQTGLDLVRVHGHVTKPEFYREADRVGMLVWQDFPLQWGYARGIRDQAARQARAMVDMLAHHSSIVIWCGHNEPVPLDVRPGQRSDADPTKRFFRRGLVAQELPNWNRTVLDRSVRRAIERADPSRPVIPHSGVLPHPPQLAGTDSHLYFGWFQGRVDDLATLASRIPRLVRFVGEFGAQAVPADPPFVDPASWPHLDWDELSHHHGLQFELLDHYVPHDGYADFDDWARATREYQGELIRRQVETLRRLKYRPTGGFCQFLFADSAPMISCSVLDHRRLPKEGWAALRDACRPVIVVADPLPSPVSPRTRVKLRVHTVSDLRHELRGVQLDARLSWREGELAWEFGGDLPADSVIRAGILDFEVPDTSGRLRLDLALYADDGDQRIRVSNTYLATVHADALTS